MESLFIRRAVNGWIVEDGGYVYVAKDAEDLATWVEEWAEKIEKKERDDRDYQG